MSRPRLLIVLVDALGSQLAMARPGFAGALRHRRGIETILGFSAGALPTLFTGRMPHEHGRFLMYQRAHGSTVFSGFSRLRWLPSRVRRSHRLTRLLTRLVAARGVVGYFNLYEVPRERLERFDLPERDDPFRPGGLPVDSLWDALDRSNLRWRGWNWRTPQADAFREALQELRGGEQDVLFVYTAELDARLHREGSLGTGVAACLDDVERFVQDACDVADSSDRPLHCVLLSDHGMVDVRSHVDVQARLSRLEVKAGTDYEVFLDSTMARFWWTTASARDQVRGALGADPRGRWLERQELEREGVWFEDKRYGEDLWLLEPGALLVPSFMGSQPVAAMHGYDPQAPDMQAFIASDRPIPDHVTHLRDVRGWLESECLALAEGANP